MGLLQKAREISKPTNVNARDMIIFAQPKVGKTHMCCQLPGEYIILDFEGGTSFFESKSVQIPDLETFVQLRDEFIEEDPSFDFIVIDTVTSLYHNIINSIAVQMYNQEEKKNKPLDWDITLLAYGQGYTYKRNALQAVVNFFKQYCRCVIMLGHSSDKSIGSSDAGGIKDLDLEGKLKNILALKTDAIAYLYRSKENENTLSFKPSEGQVVGTRIKHLANKDIVISEMDSETGELITHWDRIFITN